MRLAALLDSFIRIWLAAVIYAVYGPWAVTELVSHGVSLPTWRGFGLFDWVNHFGPFALWISATSEEVFFRLPLIFAPVRWRWSVVLVLAILFGVIHGSGSLVFVPVHGISALILSWVFLAERNAVRGFVAATASHILSNEMINDWRPVTAIMLFLSRVIYR